ncbi:TetR/AcrR family transcriptional regulator [Pseudarthrobacter chlorophenolicus]|uniref:TetR/AcrR family transcriptional regulator n=1 Tax=Pseudarthrobacter chlorophenolicus TaxID=85085 RepID=UPI0005F2D3B3|nr:TetR family transcriptional regulator [Pseudarthrobacter chlorophenolicus]
MAVTQRRFDPERRDRIISAALDVIAEAGVAGASHRKIAARADVPLGSMTYHFTGMDEVLREAFTRFAATIAVRFEARMAQATTFDEARAAVVDLIHEDLTGSARELVLTQELYTLAAREPVYRKITHAWMKQSRDALVRHFDPATCRMLDALIEGLSLHAALDTEEHHRAATAEAVARITTPAATHH